MFKSLIVGSAAALETLQFLVKLSLATGAFTILPWFVFPTRSPVQSEKFMLTYLLTKAGPECSSSRLSAGPLLRSPAPLYPPGRSWFDLSSSRGPMPCSFARRSRGPPGYRGGTPWLSLGGARYSSRRAGISSRLSLNPALTLSR